ncbi:MAG: hypothetical protein ACREOC_15645 [Gemmatimonadales bacterium]
MSWLATMVVGGAAWVFSRARSFDHAMAVFAGIFSGRGGHDTPWLIPLMGLSAAVLFIDVPQYITKSRTAMLRWPWPIRGVVYAVLVLAIVIFGADSDVRFIYFQF